MIKRLTAAATPVALALALCAPAHAQVFHGGLGGGLGGGLRLGGGLPVGSFAGDDNLRVDSTATRTTRTHARANQGVHAPATTTTARLNATASLTGTVKAPALPAPMIAVPAVPAVRTTAVALPAVRSERINLVAVPAIPDLAVRRAAIIDAGIAPITYDEVPAYLDHQYVTLQDDLRGTGVEVIKRNNQIVLEMPSDVTFAFDKYDIQPRFYGVLDAVSHTLAKYPAMYVDVDGHTDAIGSYAYNQALSERRAGTVADFLVQRGVNGARMHVEGFGKTEPIASNATIAGRAANRRVEIVLTPYTS